MFKRIFTFLFVAFFIAMLSLGTFGCSSDSSDTSDSKETTDTDDTTDLTYPIVDTNLGRCYDDSELIDCPAEGEAFYGMDAQFTETVPIYTDNGNGTVTDNFTGLVWIQDVSGYSMPWSDASDDCEALGLGGSTDWRRPNIKELWPIRNFSQGWPWVDTDDFYLVGNGSEDAQQHSWSSNDYLVDNEEAVIVLCGGLPDLRRGRQRKEPIGRLKLAANP